jgi:DNA-binding transcriptional ArsR family regulator
MLDRLRGRRRGVLIADLASEFEVTQRQVRNDLVALEEAGYTLEYGRQENRSTVILVEASSRAVPLTRRERYTLLAVRSMFDVLRDTPFYEDVASVGRDGRGRRRAPPLFTAVAGVGGDARVSQGGVGKTGAPDFAWARIARSRIRGLA